MHRGRFFILTFVGIFLVGVAAVVSTKLISVTQKSDTKSIAESFDRFGLGIAKLIANSGFIEDAYLANEPTMLSEYNIRFKRSSPTFKKIYFLGPDGKIISSTDTTLIGKSYTGKIDLNILKKKESHSVATEGLSIYGSVIRISDSIFGYVITEIDTKIEPISSTEDNLPLKLIPGVVIAIIGGLIFGFIAMSLAGKIQENVAEELAAQQEAVFSPKVRRLKEELDELIAKKEEVESKIHADEEGLNVLEQKKVDMDKQLAEHPIVKSMEKLKTSEEKLMEELNNLRAQKEQFESEIKKFEEEREELLRKIEIDRQEEKTLHEKLELIKKKILKLE